MKLLTLVCTAVVLTACTSSSLDRGTDRGSRGDMDSTLVDQSSALFERLSQLDGIFRVPTDRPNTTYVTFENASRGGSIVETWRRKNEPVHSVTVFSRDRGILYCRHYCPQLTQPILRLDSFDGTVARFSLASLTGEPGRAYMGRMTIEFAATNDTVGMQETYFENGVAGESAMRVFERVDAMRFDAN